MLINARIVADPADERRGSLRVPVDFDAQVRELGNHGSDARILNVSQTGFMAETAADLDVGSRVWLIVPGRGRANAIVRWTSAGRLGAEFDNPAEVSILNSL